ncbi:MAG: family acetyltransferase [Paenibacillaceae bacterium]|jgi:phosphinothricin acetyltransferase|nr:family acetyltransferase [Paenibacillaceae bacterium]
MEAMIIRDAIVEDLPGILEIYNDAIRRLTATFDLEEKTLEDRREWFSHYGAHHPLIVAHADGKIAGYSSLSMFREKEAFKSTAELSLYIAEDFRGRGIGKALMLEIVNRARKVGFHTIVSGITAGNEISVRMHEQFGFQYVGNFREVGSKFGRWQDVLFYQLMLE